MKMHELYSRKGTSVAAAVAVVVLAVMTGSTSAAVVTQGATNITSGQNNTVAVFAVASGDLLETSVLSRVSQLNSVGIQDTNTTTSGLTGTGLSAAQYTGNMSTQFAFSDSTDVNAFLGVTSLTDSSFGATQGGTGASKDRNQFVGIVGSGTGTGLTITYTLNTSVNALGYDISRIDAYTAWNNNGRDAVIYSVAYATVAAPAVFIPLATVNYNPGTGVVPNNTAVANQGSILDDASGSIALGVGSIRFTFTGQENNGVGYRELDVIGTAVAVPEPTTVGLLGVAASGLLARRRRTA